MMEEYQWRQQGLIRSCCRGYIQKIVPGTSALMIIILCGSGRNLIEGDAVLVSTLGRS